MKIGVEIPVEQIEKGDVFYDEDGRTAWVARADAIVVDDGEGDEMVTVAILYADGGGTIRGWDRGVKIRVGRELD